MADSDGDQGLMLCQLIEYLGRREKSNRKPIDEEDWHSVEKFKHYLSDNDHCNFTRLFTLAVIQFTQPSAGQLKTMTSFHFRNFFHAINDHFNRQIFSANEIGQAFCELFDRFLEEDNASKLSRESHHEEVHHDFMIELLAKALTTQVDFGSFIRFV